VHGGIVLYLRQEGRGIGLLNKLKAYALQNRLRYGRSQPRTRLRGRPAHYESAVEMLKFFGIRKIRLLTNNPRKIHAWRMRHPRPARSAPVGVQSLQPGVSEDQGQQVGHMLDFKEDQKL